MPTQQVIQIRVILALFAIASVLITNYVLIADEERERWREQEIGAYFRIDQTTLKYWKNYPSKISHVRTLDLHCSYLPERSNFIKLEGLEAFSQLETLIINSEYLDISMPSDDLSNKWPNLKVLKINNSKKLNLLGFLADCPALEVLDLQNNHLEVLPQELGSVKQLKVLHLGSNNLSTLRNTAFDSLEQLHYLDVSNNNLMEMDSVMFTLSELDTLLLYGNRLAELDIPRGAWASLKKLDLSSNQLATLYVEEQALPELEWLSLKSNKLYYLPYNLLTSKSLKVGVFSGNKIHLENFNAGNWPALKELYLQANELEYVPDSLWLLPNLEVLNLSNSNLLTLVDNSALIIPASRLRKLDLSDNMLAGAELDFLGQLTSLKRLRMLRDRIDELPQSLAKLSKLKLLDIGSNEFQTFPRVVTEIPNLEELYYYDYYTNDFVTINWDSLMPKVEVFNTWSPIY